MWIHTSALVQTIDGKKVVTPQKQSWVWQVSETVQPVLVWTTEQEEVKGLHVHRQIFFDRWQECLRQVRISQRVLEIVVGEPILLGQGAVMWTPSTARYKGVRYGR